MIPINDIFDFVIMAGLLTLAVLAAVARRRIFRANERVKIRPSDWLVLSDSPPNLRGSDSKAIPTAIIHAAQAVFGTSCARRAVQRQMRVPTKVTKQK